MNLSSKNLCAKENRFPKYDLELAKSVFSETRNTLRAQTSYRHLHGVERQPEGVQVVEGVVSSSRTHPILIILWDFHSHFFAFGPIATRLNSLGYLAGDHSFIINTK